MYFHSPATLLKRKKKGLVGLHLFFLLGMCWSDHGPLAGFTKTALGGARTARTG